MNKIILFNPRSSNSKYRIPNSILQVGASIHGKYEYVFVDGNMEKDPWSKIKSYLDTGDFKYFGATVMPGPQLTEAIPFSKKIREEYPSIITVWGGYFSSNQHKIVLNSGYVDYVINGPGDLTFPQLIDAIEKENLGSIKEIKNLIYKENGEIIKTAKAELPDMDLLSSLPYDYFNTFYPINYYLGKTFLGKKMFSYHASFGCPFTCSFCAVVPIYNARWKGKSASGIYKDIKYAKDKYNVDSVEFHDNNFFVSEKRVIEFSELVKNDGIKWWGEGRIDTIDKYKDSSLALMKEAGCTMIFFGAESSNDEVLEKMDKGGTQTAEQIKKFAGRMKKFGIIPEYSFVLGIPGETPEKVIKQIKDDIQFIKEIKEINPDTEIIIYVYSPVPTEGSELYERVKNMGFSFPEKLEDWLDPKWQKFDLRRNPLTPWLTPKMVRKIQNFETVLNAYYPTLSDTKLSPFKRKVMKAISWFRYKNNFTMLPYELKFLQKYWLKYRQPEWEGFEIENSLNESN